MARLAKTSPTALLAALGVALILGGCDAGDTPRSAETAAPAEEGTNMASIAEDRLVAIDVLLEPDRTMLDGAAGWNARLREQMPEGFALDAAHRPHITLLQQYVREQDVEAVLAAVDALAASADLGTMMLTANGLYHIPSGEIGLQGITVAPTPELLDLQARTIQALAPFRQTGGDQSAFAPDASGAAFDPFLFEYVGNFANDQSGENYNPHVTTGTAPLPWLEAREAEPFQDFTFGVSGLTAYRLGNFGTAAQPLADD